RELAILLGDGGAARHGERDEPQRNETHLRTSPESAPDAGDPEPGGDSAPRLASPAGPPRRPRRRRRPPAKRRCAPARPGTGAGAPGDPPARRGRGTRRASPP